MFNGKLRAILAAAAVVTAPAHAGIEGILKPMLLAGNPDDLYGPGSGDSPDQRIDPNLPTSPYSGVVSLNIRYPNPDPVTAGEFPIVSIICSGTLIDATHVLTAGHCIDTEGNGTAIDVSQSYAASSRDVRVLFNSNGNASPGNPGSVVNASGVALHPDYDGFSVCPNGSLGCANDDLAIITLSQPAPIDAQIYAIARDEQESETTSFTMVGYGETGDGLTGFVDAPSFAVKRVGTNTYDLFGRDDEVPGGAAEVWFADFDGDDGFGYLDAICYLQGVCTGDLGNQSETNIGPGDSGGPSFVRDAGGKLYLVATNTFGFDLLGAPVAGGFGAILGGVLLYSYLDWIYANSDAEDVPEPAMLGLFGLGALGLVAARRRRKTPSGAPGRPRIRPCS